MKTRERGEKLMAVTAYVRNYVGNWEVDGVGDVCSTILEKVGNLVVWAAYDRES